MLDNSCRRAYTVFMRGFGNYSILSFGTAVTNNIANASQACTENNLEGSASNKVSGLCFSGRAISRTKSIGFALITNGIVRLTERLCSDRQSFFLPPLKRVVKPRGIPATDNALTIQNSHAAYFLPKTNGNQLSNGSLFTLLLSRAEIYAVKCSYCFT